MKTLTLRPYQPDDWPALWPLLQATFAKGDTYPYPPDITEAQAHHLWVELPSALWVACLPRTPSDVPVPSPTFAPFEPLAQPEQLCGTYYLKPNQPGLGNHVGNAGYIVDERAQGLGVASAMCVHSQQQAQAMGFVAMQFNYVVSSNHRAVRLWQHHGFDIVGTLPRAFRHAQLGLVDAYVMFKTLGGRAA